jgi:hypothetical protein
VADAAFNLTPLGLKKPIHCCGTDFFQLVSNICVDAKVAVAFHGSDKVR